MHNILSSLVPKRVNSGFIGPQPGTAHDGLRSHIVIGDKQNGQIHVDFFRDMQVGIVGRPVGEDKGAPRALSPEVRVDSWMRGIDRHVSSVELGVSLVSDSRMHHDHSLTVIPSAGVVCGCESAGGSN